MAWSGQIEDIHAKRRAALEQGGAEAVARQHGAGRLTIRERIAALVDEGSFREHGRGAGSAERGPDGKLAAFTPANFILGMARIDGRPVAVGGEDFTVRGGSPNAAGLRKSVYAEDLALQYRVPLVRLHEGGGGSVTGAGGGGPVGEPVHAPRRFASVAEAMGAVPVATAALGPVAGLPASRLVAAHFAVMTRETAQVLIAGPAVVKRALGEDLTKEQLGGAEVHARSGVIDNVAKDEPDALAQIRRFLSFLPQNAWEVAGRVDSGDPPDRADVADEAPFRSRARSLAALLEGCDLAGFNIRGFDLHILLEEFRRAGVAFDLEGRRLIDAQMIFHREEPRDLAAAALFYVQEEHEGAHSARADVRVTARVLAAQLAHYPGLPRDIDGLHAYCDQVRPFLTEFRKWFSGDALGDHVFARGKHRGTRLAAVAANEPDYLEWMLTARDMHADVREVARLALERFGGRRPPGEGAGSPADGR